MATIRRRGKYWQGQVRLQGFPNRSATFDTKAEARDWAQNVEAEMRARRYVDPRPAEQTTVSDVLERYALEVAPRMSEPRRAANRARRIKQYPLAHYSLANVRGSEIREYVRAREGEDVAAGTIRMDLALLGRLFELCRREWRIPVDNPVREMGKPPIAQGRKRRLKPGEEAKLLKVAPPVFRAVLRWALETAMRREEMATLHWEHIDTSARTAHLPNTKNGEARSVPLSKQALSVLHEIPKQLDGSVFGMSANAMTLAMRRARETAGISDLRLHDLRHEAISRFFERTDLDSLEISRITGHKSMQMLSRYTHLRSGRLADRLDGQPRVQKAD